MKYKVDGTRIISTRNDWAEADTFFVARLTPKDLTYYHRDSSKLAILKRIN